MLKGILFSVILLVLLVSGGGCSSTVESPKPSPESSSVPKSVPKSESISTDKQWKIVSVNAKVTEQNNTWWKYAWILVIKNDSSGMLSFDVIVSFLDADGFIIDDDREYNLLMEAGEQKTFTGYALINASVAPNVKSVEVELKK